MNREALFKGKRIDNGEWVEGGILQTENWASIFVCKDYQGGLNETPYSDVEEYEVIPKTVGQFIGRYDRSNKKIFENDIVITKYGRKCAVVWFSSNKYNAWDLKPIGNYECKAPDKYDMWNPENLEVVGNIFDDETNKNNEIAPKRV